MLHVKLKNHKKLFIGLGITFIVILITLIFGKSRTLSRPESIVFDEINERYLISNVGSGSIAVMDMKGKIQPFIDSGMTNPRGLFLKHPYLYVADNTVIHAIDLMNKRIVATYPIEGSVMLNDIAGDGSGSLYVTDTEANCLFIFNPDSKGLQKISNPLLIKPNGLVYDSPRHQMLIVGAGNQASILIYDIRSQEISTFKETVYSQLDGIAIDDLGRIFFSSWKEEMIIMIPQEQNRFEPLIKNIISPADFIYNRRTNELLIPQMKKNKIHIHKFDK